MHCPSGWLLQWRTDVPLQAAICGTAQLPSITSLLTAILRPHYLLFIPSDLQNAISVPGWLRTDDLCYLPFRLTFASPLTPLPHLQLY